MASKQIKTVTSKSAGSSPAQTSKLQTLSSVPAVPAVAPAAPAASEVPVTLGLLQQVLQQAFKDSEQRMEQKIASMFNEKLGKIEEDMEELKGDMEELKGDMINRNQAIREDITLAIQGLAGHIEDVNIQVQEINQSKGKMEDKMEKAEDETIMIQYREMEFAVRVRGLKENRQEDLHNIFSEAFLAILEAKDLSMECQIDKIYRVNSWAARQRNLPRDVVIYFTTRRARNEMVQATFSNKLRVAGQEVLVLKEIPPKMLRNRKDYNFLVQELRKMQIQYRWEAPRGLVVNYSGQRYRLNSIWKAEDFYNNVLKVGTRFSEANKEKKNGGAEQRAEGKELMVQQQQEEVLTVRDDLIQLTNEQLLAELGKEEAKDQRQTRSATKRQEELKQLQLQSKSEPVGGARPKTKISEDMQLLIQRLHGPKDGK